MRFWLGETRRRSSLELAGGVIGIVCWSVGMRLYGLAGLGVGCALSYVLYFGLARRLARGVVGRGTTAGAASLCGAMTLVVAAFGIRAWVR